MENEVISYVYFGVSEDRSGFKIGVSQNPLRRNTQFSEKIDLLNSIKFSCQKSDAFRAGRAEYELNPHLFAKGEWRNIRERRLSFTAIINYSNSGRTIEVYKDE
jgi:hypothetical protein